MRASLISFTPQGDLLSEQITRILVSIGFNSYTKYNKNEDDLSNWLSSEFYNTNLIIFIGAMGIAFRVIGKLAKSKLTDPAVIVLDDRGQFVIPVLSGHVGRGNFFSIKIAHKLDSVPVITTATDVNSVFAVDSWAADKDLCIENPNFIKTISMELLHNNKIGFVSDYPVKGKVPNLLSNDISLSKGVYVSVYSKNIFGETLNLTPRIAHIGIGCRKNIDSEEMESFILSILNKNNISINSLASVSSIELKRNEKAIRYFSNKYNLELFFYSAHELLNVDGSFSSSSFVNSKVGVDNVCERAAVKTSRGNLLIKKQVHNGITVAICLSNFVCDFD